MLRLRPDRAGKSPLQILCLGCHSDDIEIGCGGTVLQIAAESAIVRPATPAYPVISQVFEKYLADVVNGKDPQEALDQMVSEIDADIASAGYND